MTKTVLDLINALENARGDYDDPVELVRPVIGREPDRFEIVEISYTAGGEDGYGAMQIMISKL